MRRALVFLLAGCASAATITSSDVPGAVVTVSNEQFNYYAAIEGEGDFWQLNWSAYVGFDMATTCSPDPGYSCSQYTALQTGEDWQKIQHHASVTYQWTVPMFAPGEGMLIGKPGVQPEDWNFFYDSGVGNPSSGSTSAGITLPSMIERGKPFNAVITITVDGFTAADYESFAGSRTYSAELIPVAHMPEPSSYVLFGSGILLIGLRRKASRYLRARC